MQGPTSEAIDKTIIVLSYGASTKIIKMALMLQGFTSQKADIIIRWAKQHIVKDKDGNTT